MKIKRHNSVWDVLRSSDYTYIVRNDLEENESYCMRFKGAAGESGTPEIFNVSDALKQGEHYLGYSDDGRNYKYVIRDNRYIRASDIVKGTNLGNTVALHKDFQGGDFYFQRDGRFYKVKLETDSKGKAISGWFVYGSRLSKKASKRYNLNGDVIALNPLCIWGNGKYYYILCEDDFAGLLVKRTTAISDKNHSEFKSFPVSDEVAKFLPGGLSATEGKMSIVWERIAHEDNRSSVDVDLKQTITTRSGVSKQLIDTIERNWSVKSQSETSVGILVAQAEISTETQVGGSISHTEQKMWYEEKTVTTEMRCKVRPRSEISIYRARVKMPYLGDVFLGERLTTTENGELPEEVCI